MSYSSVQCPSSSAFRNINGQRSALSGGMTSRISMPLRGMTPLDSTITLAKLELNATIRNSRSTETTSSVELSSSDSM